jgi:hypothetical protein
LLILAAPWPGKEQAEGEAAAEAPVPAPSGKAKAAKVATERAVGPFRTDVIGLSRCKTWLDDVLVALRTVEHPESGVKSEGVWTEARDFLWRDAPKGVARPEAQMAADTGGNALPLGQLAAEIVAVPMKVCNPSGAGTVQGGIPPAERLGGKPWDKAGDPRLFAKAKQEGSVVHRVFELWGFRGELADAVVARALEDVLPGAAQNQVHARTQHVRALIEHACACQPGLLEELREAAGRGEVLHEVDMQAMVPAEEPTVVVGQIDLLYRGSDGAWHLIDYKSSEVEEEDPKKHKGLEDRIAEYYGQVREYAVRVVALLPAGQRLATFGLWFVKDGAVVRWK